MNELFPHLVYDCETNKLWIVLATDTEDATNRVVKTSGSDGDSLSAVHIVPEEQPFEVIGLLE